MWPQRHSPSESPVSDVVGFNGISLVGGKSSLDYALLT